MISQISTNQSTKTKQFTFNSITFKYTVLPLKLKRSFNTAHSTSTFRNNFLVCIISNKLNVKGYGQCGLPPKKPNCYLADIKDCFQCMEQLSLNLVQKQSNNKQQMIQNIRTKSKQFFEEIDQKYFQQMRSKNFQKLFQIDQNQTKLAQIQYLSQIMHILTTLKKISQTNKCFLAAKSAIQFAILDQFSKKLNMKASKLIYNQNQNQQNQKKSCFSFYTLSHQSQHQMIQNGKFGQAYTKFLKIKFDNNIESLLNLLLALDKQKIGQSWIIDANASWSLEDYKLFQKKLNEDIKYQSVLSKIMFIQQPFPVVLNQIQFNQWKQVKNQTKLKLIVDQSFSNWKDIKKMKQISHGINIKMQKCGGPFQATKILSKLSQQKVEIVMFGSMVSSQLGCTQVYQFKNFAQYFDIDGALLVQSPIIKGGFEWEYNEGLIQLGSIGLCIEEKNFQPLFQ